MNNRQICLRIHGLQAFSSALYPFGPLPSVLNLLTILHTYTVFHRIGVDVIQFPKSHTGNQYGVVFVDYLTKWPEFFATLDQTALTIAKLLVEPIFCHHEVSAQLLSDRGAAFLSHLLTEICKLLE